MIHPQPPSGPGGLLHRRRGPSHSSGRKRVSPLTWMDLTPRPPTEAGRVLVSDPGQPAAHPAVQDPTEEEVGGRPGSALSRTSPVVTGIRPPFSLCDPGIRGSFLPSRFRERPRGDVTYPRTTYVSSDSDPSDHTPRRFLWGIRLLRVGPVGTGSPPGPREGLRLDDDDLCGLSLQCSLLRDPTCVPCDPYSPAIP